MSLELVLDALGRAPTIQDLLARLPGRGAALRLGGLPGSSGAVLTAWLVRSLPQRLFVVVAPSPGDAERWLGDLTLLTDAPAALYPQREALGEDEPHYEIAGERAETIEALLRGRLRILVTTARATAERTLVPAALDQLTLPLAVGARQPLRDVVAALERMGYRRVPTVTEVAEFSVRGGIVDVYGFGMAAPARAEWWGDEISSLRGFDLTSQRSLEELAAVTVLPITTAGVRDGVEAGPDVGAEAGGGEGRGGRGLAGLGQPPPVPPAPTPPAKATPGPPHRAAPRRPVDRPNTPTPQNAPSTSPGPTDAKPARTHSRPNDAKPAQTSNPIRDQVLDVDWTQHH